MNINILTIFPEIFNVLNSGVVSKPIKNKTLKLNTYDIRKNAVNKHNHVDAKPYGGGEGMVIMAEPVVKSLNQIAKSKLGKVIYLTPQGNKLNQKKVLNLSKLRNITLICGRYEGIDQRIIDKYVDEEISIGDYILSGGEIAASVVIDAMIRNKKSVIGNSESVKNDSLSKGRLKGHVFTRPNEFKDQKVPEILLSGDHKKIEEWKIGNSLWVTREKRPDLFKQLQLSEKEMILLRQYEDSIL